VSPGQTITVPVHLNQATDLLALDLTLRYDTSLLDTIQVKNSSLVQDFSLVTNINEAQGQIDLTLFGTQPLASGIGSVVELDFQVSDQATIGEIIPLDLTQGTFSTLGGDRPLSLQDGSLLIEHPTFRVIDFQANASGFVAQLNRDLAAQHLNLYDGQDAGIDPADITVIGDNSGPIDGSVVWDATARTVTFVKTGDILANDRYQVQFASRADGFVDTGGEHLDGDGDGTAGGDYRHSFTINQAPAVRVVHLPDLVRGGGQAVDIPATDQGFPLWIDNGEAVQNIDLTLSYDSDLLTIEDLLLADTLPAGWQGVINHGAPGHLVLSLFGATPLAAGKVELGRLQAQVPSDAPYGDSGVVHIESLQINEGQIAAQGDSALHQVAYIGDVNGDQAYSGLDAALIARHSVGLDHGFDAYGNTDPLLLADVSGNGRVSGLDAAFVARKAIDLPQPEIPDLPRDEPDPTIDLLATRFNVGADTARAGDAIDVTFEVENQGNSDSGTFRADFYLSTDATITPDDYLLGSYNLGSIAGAQSSGVLNQRFTLPNANDSFWFRSGTHQVGMIVDGANIVQETDETNNANTDFDWDPVFITLTQPTLEVTSPNQATTLMQGRAYDITWQDNFSENVKIELLKGGRGGSGDRCHHPQRWPLHLDSAPGSGPG
jgi:hypothetical protein